VLNKLKALLQFLKVTDDDHTVSLSCLLVWVVVIKSALIPSLGILEVGALLLVLLNYNARKFWQSKRHKYSDETLAALNNLNAKIDRTQVEVQILQNAGSMADIVNRFRG